MPSRRDLQRLSVRAREAVHGLIAGFEEGAEDGEELAPCLLLLKNLDDEIPEILGEVMERGGWRARMFAAVMFCKGVESYPRVALKHPDLLATAESILVASCATPRDDVSLQLTCEMMGRIGVVPRPVIPYLEALIEHYDDLTAAYAATALFWVPEKGSQASDVLGRCMASTNVRTRLIAAIPLALRRIRMDLAISTLVEVLPQLKRNEKCGVVRHLQDIGPPAIRTLPVLKDMLVDESLSSFCRARVAAAIGSITRGTRDGVGLLSEALWSSDWQVVNGAADGLAIHGGYAKAEIKRLIHLLESENKDMRGDAAIALQRFGPRACMAVPDLINRFIKEPDAQLCKGLTETLAAIGLDAVGPLIEAAKQNDFRTLSLVAASLKGIGEAAVGPVTHALLSDADEQVRFIGILILREMGSKAAPAVPVLAAMLASASDLETIHTLIATIGVCGQAAEQATGAIVDALVRSDDNEVEDIAGKVLKGFGDPARAFLEAAQPTASQSVRSRIHRIIAACQPSADNRFPRLEQLNRDDLLKLFALVGEVFENNETAGWRLVVAKIKDKVNFKRPNGVPFGMRDKSVADAIKELGTLLGAPLTENSPNQASRLTSAGTALLAESREYLRAKYDTP